MPAYGFIMGKHQNLEEKKGYGKMRNSELTHLFSLRYRHFCILEIVPYFLEFIMNSPKSVGGT